MSAITKIEWTDKTWNPVRGCSLVSPGCSNCYAMRVAHRFSAPGDPYAGLTIKTHSGPKWSGRIRLVPEALDEPLHWRKPCRVFVNSMSDLFHEDVPFEFIDRVFVVMAKARKHTFQILTKRPLVMREYIRQRSREPHILSLFCAEYRIEPIGDEIPWPLPNVWLGVSVEDQESANGRIPLLFQIPAAVKFLSVEPLLERINLDTAFMDSGSDGEPAPCTNRNHHHVDWLIAGGESGLHARPCHIDWIRDVVRQSREARVKCFVKQLGSLPVMDENVWQAMSPKRLLNPRNHRRAPAGTVPIAMSDSKGGKIEEFPKDLRIREFPNDSNRP